MRQTKCSLCSSEVPLRSCRVVNDQLCCESCAEKKAAEFTSKFVKFDDSPAIDPTVCYRCNADGGETEFESLEGTPCCPACYDTAYKRAVSKRLRVAVVLLLVAVGFALYRGLPYIRAARTLNKAESLVQAQQYSEAIPLLQSAVNNSPGCEKCVLLLGKSLLKTGYALEAEKVLRGHNGGHFEKEPALTNEVNGMMGRASSAYAKAELAANMYQAKDKQGTVKLLREAADLYPERQGFADTATQIELEIATEQRDYDRFLALGKQVADKYPTDPLALAQYASGLACKYAVTGDNAFRTQSEEVLQKARTLVAAPQQKAEFDSYDERIQYRLKTRVIIDKAEYERRFKQQPKASTAK